MRPLQVSIATSQIVIVRFEMSHLLSPALCCAPLDAPTLTDQEAEATAALFAALGNPARVRIVNLLAGSDEAVCLCNLVGPLGLAQATVSQHLKRLVEAGLLHREERGKWSYFSINAEAMEQVAFLADLKRPSEGVCC